MSDPSTTLFATLFESALLDYEKQTGTRLTEHPLAQQLENCDSIEFVTVILHEQAGAFSEFRRSDGRIMKSLKSVVSVLYTLSTSSVLGGAIGLSFPPANAIFAGFAVLLAAAKDVSGSYDALVDVLESIDHFLTRLNVYTNISPTPAMREIIVKIMVELLSILALVTKQFKQRRSMKLVKKLLGENQVEAVLQRLDRLTQDEARTTAAQTLEVVYGLVQNTRVVMDDGKASVDSVRGALEIIQQMVSDRNKSKRDKIQQNIRNWLASPDPWKNHNIALESRHTGTAAWFVQGDIFPKWKSSGPSSLLWIHGKPGAGKTILCSTIIQDIDAMRKSGLASLAFFYCDFREDQKKDRRGLLSSILVQLCCQSDSYCDILSDFYLEHGKGSQYPSDDALVRCLKGILKIPGQPPVFLIVDALDECPITSAMPSPREKVLMLVEELIGSQLGNLRVCVTSRPETDIKAVLDDLTFHSVSIHDERGQLEDINNYIKSVVNEDPRMRKWNARDKQAVIDVLMKKADGMFRWVYCQVVYLRRCLPGRIRRALYELPETLDETYERTLRDIDKANWESAHRLFQCVAVAARPLRVEEVTEFLTLDFDASPIPRFVEDWRPDDPVDAVLSTCPSLLAIVNVEDSHVIQFSHFSVKEFLTSPRLAESSSITYRRYHISTAPAHALVTQACLGMLLHLDPGLTNDDLQKFPLAEYAAQHWVGHAQFEDVSRSVEDGMKQLFDPDLPHLAVWVWVHDPDILSRRRRRRAERPSEPSASSLHYAALCGLHWTVKSLLTEHSLDVDAPGFKDKSTALHRASSRGHVEVARVLLNHGANVTARAKDGTTPLHHASSEGHVRVACLLLEHGADVTARDEHGWAPLDEVSFGGHVGLARILLEHGTDATAQTKNGSTPLHLASTEGHVEVARILLERGGDATAQTEDGSTPLHRASFAGHAQVARVLLEYGADVKARDKCGSTALHRASFDGHVEVIRVLLGHDADVEAKDNDGSSPVDIANSGRHVNVFPILVESMIRWSARGLFRWNPLHRTPSGGHMVIRDLGPDADATARDEGGWTPLHRASVKGDIEFTRILLARGACVTVQAEGGWTPLHLASQEGHVQVVRDLLAHGADVGARNEDRSTPLHQASQGGHVELALVLLEHGADLTAQDETQRTPLHRASGGGHIELTRTLLEHGADVTARDVIQTTPLHRASQGGHVELARILLEHGADATAQDEDMENPLFRASIGGHVELARLLLEHGLDPAAQTKDGATPLHFASIGGHVELALFFLQHGAAASAQDEDKMTPLTMTALGGHTKLANILLEHGADATENTNDGSTPLHFTSLGGHVELARVFLDHGADATAQDDRGCTPLHLASQGGHIEVARVLLERGADMSAQDKNGRTPLHRASSKGHVGLTHVLLDCGADTAAQAQDGGTPLHDASQEGRSEVVRALLEHGADASIQDKDGSNPWHLASRGGHVRVARLLLQYGADPGADDNANLVRSHEP